MQIHELNNFTGTLGSGAYLAIDDGNDTGKISSQGLLAATEARIDNIIAGPAPSAEEIVDARLGDDGATYPSLGDAIRDQFSDVKSAISNFSAFFEGKGNTYASDVYIDLEVGHSYRVYVNSWDVTGVTAGSGFDKFVLGYNSNGTDNTIYSRKMPDTISAFYDMDIPTSAINPKLFVGGRVTSGKFGILHIEDRTALLETADLNANVSYNGKTGLGKVLSSPKDWVVNGNYLDTASNLNAMQNDVYITYDEGYRVYIFGYASDNTTVVYNRNAWYTDQKPIVLPKGHYYKIQFSKTGYATQKSDLSHLQVSFISPIPYADNGINADDFVVGTFDTTTKKPNASVKSRVCTKGLVEFKTDALLFVTDQTYEVYIAKYDSEETYVSAQTWSNGSGYLVESGYLYAFSIKKATEDGTQIEYGSETFYSFVNSLKALSLSSFDPIAVYKKIDDIVHDMHDALTGTNYGANYSVNSDGVSKTYMQVTSMKKLYIPNEQQTAPSCNQQGAAYENGKVIVATCENGNVNCTLDVWDYETATRLYSFPVPNDATWHGNNVTATGIWYDETDICSLLMVSDCKSNGSLIICRLTEAGCTVLHKIEFSVSDVGYFANYLYNEQNGTVVSLGYTIESVTEPTNNPMVVCVWDIDNWDDPNETPSATMRYKYTLPYMDIFNGGIIRNGIIYAMCTPFQFSDYTYIAISPIEAKTITNRWHFSEKVEYENINFVDDNTIMYGAYWFYKCRLNMVYPNALI